MNLEWQPAEPEGTEVPEAPAPETAGPPAPLAPLAPPAATTQRAPAQRSGRSANRAKLLGALVLGGIGGAAIIGPLTAAAASPAPTTATAPSATTGTDTDGDHDTGHHGPGGHGPGGPGFGGHNEAVSDTSVVAKAIGISETDLTTALQGGQTIAAVAKAHDVDVQQVIDALVADAKDELAAAVKAGTLTQAQADAEQANVLARVTAQVNGTFMGGPRMGGPRA